MTALLKPADAPLNAHHPPPLAAFIYLVGGVKGGVCKSVTAIFLARVYAALGYKVLIIDADDASGTARRWNRKAKHRNDPLPFTVIPHPSEDLAETIEENGWHAEYDIIIIDTGGHADRVLRAAYSVADHFILPLSPSPAEMDTLSTTAESTVAFGDRGIPVTIVMVRVKSTKMEETARGELDAAGFSVLPSRVADRMLYQRVYGWNPQESELMEYAEIRRELEDVLPVPPPRQGAHTHG